MPEGVIIGGWQYVAAAYAIFFVVIAAYALFLVRRVRRATELGEQRANSGNRRDAVASEPRSRE